MDARQIRMFGVLVGALVMLLAVLWVGPSPQEEDGSAVHAGFSLDAAVSVRLERAGAGGVVELSKEDGVWWVRRPFDASADPDVVFGVLEAIQSARRAHVLDDGLPADFGLAEPTVTAIVGLADGTERTLTLGARAPVGVRTYALTSDARIGVVDGHPADLLTKRPAEYQDHKVFRFRPDEVERVRVRSALGTLEATKQGQDWFVTGYGHADLDALEDWLIDLLRLRVDLFLDLDHTTLDDPRFEVEVVTSEGVQRMLVGRDTPYGPLVLFKDGLDGVVEPGLLAMLERGPTDVGVAEAFPFDPETTTRVELSGERTATLEPPWAEVPAARSLQHAQLTYRLDTPQWSTTSLTVRLIGQREQTFEVSAPDGEGFRLIRDVTGGDPVRVPDEEVADLFR